MEAGMCVPGCQEVIQRSLNRRGFFKGAAAASFAAAAVSPADAAPRGFRSVVDLTHVMSPEFPTFFGVPGIEIQKQFEFKRDGFNLNWWRIIEHAGTHLDAPLHFSDSGPVDTIVAGELVVPLAVVDVRRQASQNADYLLSRQDIVDWERRYRRLPNNCCVAMMSGWGQYVSNPAKFTGKDAAGVFHFPGFAPDAVEWLLSERRVSGIAVDTLSLDNGPSKDFKTHRAWLPTGRWGLENVANLERVPASGATLVVGVAKVKDATGAPARLIALV